MKRKNVTLTVVLLAGIGIAGLHAQSNIVASGGNASGSNGSISYSIGLIAYESAIGPTGSVNTGLQQPYEFFTIGIEDNKNISISAVVYPNPTATSVILRVANQTLENLYCQLYDTNCKIILKQTINSSETSIKMEDNIPGTYYLKINKGKTELKTIKIIKNN